MNETAHRQPPPWRRPWRIVGMLMLAGVVVVVVLARAHSKKEGGPPGRPTTAPSAQPTTAEDADGIPDGWRRLEDGLEFGIFTAPRRSEVSDSRIRILRIDPAKFEFRLLNASAPGQGEPLTAGQWCRRNGLVAAINASMYQKDHRTSVSLMRSGNHVNNPSLSKDNAILVFDRLDPDAAAVRIADLEFEKFQDVSRQYGTLVQSIRMVSATGRNVWSVQPTEWSAAAIGMDKRGRALFIHVRSPYRMHDLIDVLLGLPIDLKNAMYVEGGPEAQLCVSSGPTELELVGSYETRFREDDTNTRAWPVPNVVGIARRR